jgi:hypothetical protein
MDILNLPKSIIFYKQKKKLPCAALLFEKQSMTNQAIGPFGK